MTLENKEFVRKLTVVAIPIVLQNLLQQSLSFCDTLMIGQLGEIEIASVGLANQFYFLVSVIFFGVSTGTSIFTSQFWGNKDVKSMEKAVGAGLIFGVLISLLFSLSSIFFPQTVISIFNKDQDVIACGSSYLRLVGISYIFVSVSQTISQNIRSTGETKKPMYATFASMVINIIGNYFLIFVLKLGVAGAAISTTVSRFLEMIFIILINQKSSAVPLVLKEVFAWDKKFVSSFIKTSVPVILDDTQWALGMTVYKYVYSRMGTQVLAAVNITESVQNLFLVFQLALGSAAAIIIGNEIGKGNKEKALIEGKVSNVAAVVCGLACSVLMCSVAFVLPLFFNVSGYVKELSKLSIIVLSIELTLKFINHVNIVALFRSGGDTNFILYTEIFTIWLIGVPSAIFSGLIFHLPIYIVYLCVGLEEVVKVFVCFPRLKSGKWIHDLTSFSNK